jgi:TRAP-type C4-dicarboxylate transport system permease small subunit
MPALTTQAAAPALLVGCLAVVVLSVWLPVTAARRWVPARWRAVTASAGSALVLAAGVALAVVSFSALTR